MTFLLPTSFSCAIARRSFFGPLIVPNSQVSKAKEKLTSARYAADLYVKIDAAIAAADDEALSSLVHDAEEHGLTGSKIDQAKVQCDRVNATAEAKEKIATASASNNLKMLNEGLEMAIQVGVLSVELFVGHVFAPGSHLLRTTTPTELTVVVLRRSLARPHRRRHRRRERAARQAHRAVQVPDRAERGDEDARGQV